MNNLFPKVRLCAGICQVRTAVVRLSLRGTYREDPAQCPLHVRIGQDAPLWDDHYEPSLTADVRRCMITLPLRATSGVMHSESAQQGDDQHSLDKYPLLHILRVWSKPLREVV
jgi:hypothetical protein